MGKGRKNNKKNNSSKSKSQSNGPRSTKTNNPQNTTAADRSSSSPQPESRWQSYGLDQIAQRLVLDARKRDIETLNQGHKMRMAVAYGLERFWGEHLRLYTSSSKKEKRKTGAQENKDKIVNQTKEDKYPKATYWKETWDALVTLMASTGMTLPNDEIDHVTKRSSKEAQAKQADQIEKMSKKLWDLSLEDQRIAIAVLTQLCDSIVWWTQRYKLGKGNNGDS